MCLYPGGRIIHLVALLLLAAASSACVWPGDYALQRASREFSCPPERVNVLSRDDVSESLFDVEACGQRARYNCPLTQAAPLDCIREPDPIRWEPDPTICSKHDTAKPEPHGCYTHPGLGTSTPTDPQHKGIFG
jgi:hypothetical protein